jgi:hypothetical protein
VIWDDQSKFTSKVAVVPFSEDIRLPTTTALNKARGTTLPSSKSASSTTYYLSDCVVERTGTQKYTDAAPGAGQYVMGHYTTTFTGTGGSKKGVCTVPSGAEVTPLSSDKQALLAKVTSLSAAGGTAGHLGTAWAWYALSPNWSSLWPSSAPAAYGSANLEKIAILMTDGEYNTQYDSNGIAVNQNSYTTCSSAANGCSTTQARALCTAMKAKGIVVYTIGFQLGGNQTAIDTLNQCATEPGKFYTADNGDQLKQAFRDIALKLTSLYLSKWHPRPSPAAERASISRCTPFFACQRMSADQASSMQSSSKPASTSAINACSASGPWGPCARKCSVEPGPAASIISPMIEVPPTEWPSRVTVIAASKVSASFTNLADARACKPLRLRIVTIASGRRLSLISGMR